jgi:hypothetical protein
MDMDKTFEQLKEEDNWDTYWLMKKYPERFGGKKDVEEDTEEDAEEDTEEDAEEKVTTKSLQDKIDWICWSIEQRGKVYYDWRGYDDRIRYKDFEYKDWY